MTRRVCFVLLIGCHGLLAFAHPKLGDEDWMRRIRAFVKTFNAFVEVLNDGNFDVAKWYSMRSACKELDAE